MQQQLSKPARWTGRVLSGIVILFMVTDALFKFLITPEAVEATAQLGYEQHHFIPMGVLALTCTLLYAIPRTAILGAVLMSAYYGGAIATHFRVDNPLFSHMLFPVYLAVLMWGGLWLRDRTLQQVFPFKTTN